MQRLAKPWYRRRALRIFRDQTGLAVTPALWGSIESALDASRAFVLLASPQAAASPWVNREVEHWKQTNPPRPILPVLTEGEWVWDAQRHDFDFERSNAVPDALRSAFAEEPRHLDLRWARSETQLDLRHGRFREAIADLAAPLHGRTKDELEGDDIRQHRRALRLAWSGVATLGLLTAAAVVAGVLAVSNANRAEETARGATSRALAAQAIVDLDGAFDRGALLSLEAYRLAPTPESRDALFRAAERTSGLLGILRADADGGLVFSPDGRRLASAGRRNVLVWDVESMRRVETLTYGVVWGVDFGPDGTMAVARDDRIALRRRVGGRWRTLHKASERIEFSPSGRMLASSGSGGGIIDTRSGRMLETFVNSLSVTFSPRNGLLAVRASDETITLRNATTFGVVGELPGSRDTTADPAFSPDGLTIAAGREDGSVQLWDTVSRLPLETLHGHDDAVESVAFRADGTLASGSRDGAVILWDAVSYRRISVLRAFGEQVEEMAFSPDGRTLATSDSRGSILLWDTKAPLRTLRHGNGVVEARFSPDGRRVVSAGGGAATVWDARTGKRLETFDQGVAMSFVPGQERTLASLGQDGRVRLWNVETGRTRGELLTWAVDEHTPSSLAFSADGRTLAVGESAARFDGRGRVLLWDVSNRRRLGVISHGRYIDSLAFDPSDRRTVAVGASTDEEESETVTLWDVDSVQLRAGPLRGASGSVAYSPDGRMIAATGASTVLVWRSRDTALLATLPGFGESVTFGPEGDLLASASRDSALLWDVPSFRRIGDPFPTDGAVVFAPRGDTVATSSDQEVIVRRLPVPQEDAAPLREALCRIVRRNLTETEWSQFLPGRRYRETCGNRFVGSGSS